MTITCAICGKEILLARHTVTCGSKACRRERDKMQRRLAYKTMPPEKKAATLQKHREYQKTYKVKEPTQEQIADKAKRNREYRLKDVEKYREYQRDRKRKLRPTRKAK